MQYFLSVAKPYETNNLVRLWNNCCIDAKKLCLSVLNHFFPMFPSDLPPENIRKLFFYYFLKFGWHNVGNKAKGRISKRVFQENKARQIFQKTNISYLLIRHISFPLIRTCMYAYQGVRHYRFSENLECFVFLKYPFWDSPFCLITEDDQFIFSEKAFLRNLLSSGVQ